MIHEKYFSFLEELDLKETKQLIKKGVHILMKKTHPYTHQALLWSPLGTDKACHHFMGFEEDARGLGIGSLYSGYRRQQEHPMALSLFAQWRDLQKDSAYNGFVSQQGTLN